MLTRNGERYSSYFASIFAFCPHIHCQSVCVCVWMKLQHLCAFCFVLKSLWNSSFIAWWWFQYFSFSFSLRILFHSNSLFPHHLCCRALAELWSKTCFWLSISLIIHNNMCYCYCFVFIFLASLLHFFVLVWNFTFLFLSLSVLFFAMVRCRSFFRSVAGLFFSLVLFMNMFLCLCARMLQDRYSVLCDAVNFYLSAQFHQILF